MKTKKNTPVRINSIDFVIAGFLIKLDSIMARTSISKIWNSAELWSYSFNRYTSVPEKSDERPVEGFKIRPSFWGDESFINLVIRRDSEYGWRILLGYIHNPDFGIYNDFHFDCHFLGDFLLITPRIPKERDRFTQNEKAVSEFFETLKKEAEAIRRKYQDIYSK